MITSSGQTPEQFRSAQPIEKARSRSNPIKTIHRWLGAGALSVLCATGGFGAATLTHHNSPQQNEAISACEAKAPNTALEADCSSQLGNKGGLAADLEIALGIIGAAGVLVSLVEVHQTATEAMYPIR